MITHEEAPQLVNLPLSRRAFPHWQCSFSLEKLLMRGQLAGASLYDKTTDALRQARQAGVPALTLLPAATGSSWMVNNTVTSALFQQWLHPSKLAHWESLLALLEGTNDNYLQRKDELREPLSQTLQALWLPQAGAAGLSKVLALLCPDVVPLMDDAALWYALDRVSYPANAQVITSKTNDFIDMLDWFATQAHTQQETLTLLATAYPLCQLSPAQVLDRLLWFESWGYHLFQQQLQWRWVAHGEQQGIVPLAEAPKTTDYSLPLTISPDAAEEWQIDAWESLQASYGIL